MRWNQRRSSHCRTRTLNGLDRWKAKNYISKLQRGEGLNMAAAEREADRWFADEFALYSNLLHIIPRSCLEPWLWMIHIPVSLLMMNAEPDSDSKPQWEKSLGHSGFPTHMWMFRLLLLCPRSAASCTKCSIKAQAPRADDLTAERLFVIVKRWEGRGHRKVQL
ncbi:hypothetical protein B0T13DRAFT_474711 [Neurospora crassa]|nr:hypothetical protein B0T13DRAFT_474711 [Neurospora crassa]